MKQGDLLRVELCGPESNPKESGEFHTIENGVNHSAWYNSISGGWYEYEPLPNITYGNGLYPERVSPKLWLKPVGKTEEELLEEAFNAGQESLEATWNDDDEPVTEEVKTFWDFREE